jgi:uncharacterized protein YbjT (DUF2867 family)
MYKQKDKIMKYLITGGAGNIAKPLTEKLLKAGHQVTIISRSADNIKSLTDLGAKAAIGSVTDVDFLTNIFAEADAVYTMVPPKYDAPDMKAHIASIGRNYVEALKPSDVKYVVNLSSVGAHLADGCGPVNGLYQVEQAMGELKNINIKHLRPVWFFTNLFANINMIKHMNIVGGNFGGGNFKMLMVHPNDIADVAFEELDNLNFTGHSVRYIASDERTTDDIASVIGQAINKPQLPWVTFTDEQAYGGMVQAGLPENIAKNYTEMGHAMQDGSMFSDYWKHRPTTFGKTKLEDFAHVFASVYNSN